MDREYIELRQEEMRAEAQEYLEAQMDAEFDMTYSKEEILKELFENISKEEIIEYMTTHKDYYDNDEFEEFKEELKREYLENR